MRTTAALASLGLAAAVLAPAAPALVPVASWTDIAPVELASPALVEPRDGVLEVWTRGPRGDLVRQERSPSGAWSSPRSGGGILTSSPAATSMAPGRTDVFARGGSGQVVHKWLVDGQWSGWTHLGGSIVGSPGVVSMHPGRIDLFALGTAGDLLHRFMIGGAWSGWESLGGSLASGPAAVSMVFGRLDVFARGSDAQLHHLFYTPGSWSGWERLGGVLHSEPSAIALGDGRIDVLVRGGEGDLRQKSFVRGPGWGAWTRLPGPVASGPSVELLHDGSAVVGARDGASRYLVRSRAAGSAVWSDWSLVDAIRPFRRAGAWVDLYDYELPGATLSRDAALDDLRARGVQTLYLQTSRFSVDVDVASRAASWLDGAHARGMSVVGWYLPGYGDLARDVRRTLAIATFVTPAGGRFDGVGVDIEAHTGWGTTNEVPRTTMNTRAVEHLRWVRGATNAPLAAIAPQPVATDGVGETWEGFPWRSVGGLVDLVVPMAYWPRTCHDLCVDDYTTTNARLARSWSGRPVHVVGRGYPSADGTRVTDADMAAFVQGALEAGVVGGSFYDYASTRTRTNFWVQLQRFNLL